MRGLPGLSGKIFYPILTNCLEFNARMRYIVRLALFWRLPAASARVVGTGPAGRRPNDFSTDFSNPKEPDDESCRPFSSLFAMGERKSL